jgi:hypothetical protein
LPDRSQASKFAIAILHVTIASTRIRIIASPVRALIDVPAGWSFPPGESG